MRISFGPFAFDRQSRLLWRDGAEVALPPRVLGVLEVLIDRPGQVVARQDLLDGVWKDAFVTDTSLAEAISFLRQALGDDPQSPRYIQTVHRRGYRFLAPLSEIPERGAPLTDVATPGPHLRQGYGGQEPGDRGETPPPPETGARPRTPDYPLAPASADQTPGAGWELMPWSGAILCAATGASAVWRMTRLPAPEAPPIA